MQKKDVKLGAIVRHTGNGEFFAVVDDTVNSAKEAASVILGRIVPVNKRGRLVADEVEVVASIYDYSVGGFDLVKPGTGKLPKGIRLDSRTKSEYCTVAIRTDDPEMKHCDCKICLYGREIHALALRQATTQDRARVEKLYERLCCAEEDADYWRIHAHGGFEAIEKTLFHKKYTKMHAERTEAKD